MRERRRLEEAINATNTIERELSDTPTHRNGRGRGDNALSRTHQSLAELAARAERDKVAALLAGEADANNSLSRSPPAPAGPKVRIGLRC